MVPQYVLEQGPTYHTYSETTKCSLLPKDEALSTTKMLHKKMKNTSAGSSPCTAAASTSCQISPTLQAAINIRDRPTASSAVSSHTQSSLMSLSNELLSIIMLHFCGDSTLLDLALVNIRIRGVAQDAMLRRLCVPKKGIKQLLVMLASNPDGLSKIGHLDLRKYAYGHLGDRQCLGSVSLDTHTMHLLENLANANGKHVSIWSRIQAVGRDANVWYDRSHSLLLDVLAAVLPTLKEVTVWLPPHGDAAQARPLLRPHAFQHPSVAPFEGVVLEVMQRLLQRLTIESDPKYKCNAAHMITLPAFLSLRSLTISMEHLGSPKRIVFYSLIPDDVPAHDEDDKLKSLFEKMTCLPLTLRELRLTSCTKMTFVLLDVFNSLPAGCLQLKRISLAFDMPASSALVLCATEGQKVCTITKACSWMQTLVELAKKGLNVYFNTEATVTTSERKAIFMEELSAMSTLTEGEIATILLAGMQLSDCAARNRFGFRPRTSTLERELFSLHGTGYPVLFSSPTFVPYVWADVAFFHGAQKTKMQWDPPNDAEGDDKEDLKHVVTEERNKLKLKMKRTKIITGGPAYSSTCNFTISACPPPLEERSAPRIVFVYSGVITSLPSSGLPSRKRHYRPRTVPQSQAKQSFHDSGSNPAALTVPLDYKSGFAKHIFQLVDWKAQLQPCSEGVEENEAKTAELRSTSSKTTRHYGNRVLQKGQVDSFEKPTRI